MLNAPNPTDSNREPYEKRERHSHIHDGDERAPVVWDIDVDSLNSDTRKGKGGNWKCWRKIPVQQCRHRHCTREYGRPDHLLNLGAIDAKCGNTEPNHACQRE